MPNNDDIAHSRSPITPPEGDIEEREIYEPEPVPVSGSKQGWNWIGSPSRPEAKKYRDGVSDLFRADFDGDSEDVNDLVTVDIKHDVLDAGHDGTLDDLVDVFPEDIMGVDSIGQRPSRKHLRKLRAERKARQSASGSTTSVGGMTG